VSPVADLSEADIAAVVRVCPGIAIVVARRVQERGLRNLREDAAALAENPDLPICESCERPILEHDTGRAHSEDGVDVCGRCAAQEKAAGEEAK
jgi:hypothetical protein